MCQLHEAPHAHTVTHLVFQNTHLIFRTRFLPPTLCVWR
nr:MAG TPA: hypothetical protein [Caudoviricetes sp.]